jgi:hypothetical protein
MDRTSVDKVLILPASAATAPTGSRK